MALLWDWTFDIEAAVDGATEAEMAADLDIFMPPVDFEAGRVSLARVFPVRVTLMRAAGTRARRFLRA